MVEQEVLDCMNDIIKKLERREYRRQYRLNNQEKIKESDRQHRLRHKEKIKQCKIKYNQTDKGRKSSKIIVWKQRGVITDNWDAMYDHYIQTSFCDFCKVELSYDKHNTATTKCLDHDHTITDRPNFRNILCHPCNVKRG